MMCCSLITAYVTTVFHCRRSGRSLPASGQAPSAATNRKGFRWLPPQPPSLAPYEAFPDPARPFSAGQDVFDKSSAKPAACAIRGFADGFRKGGFPELSGRESPPGVCTEENPADPRRQWNSKPLPRL